MKRILLLTLICLACDTYAADNQTTIKKKITHHVQFLVGNYASQSLVSTSHTSYPQLMPQYLVPITGVYNPLFYSYGYERGVAVPFYSYSVGFNYKAEFSERLGIRTGINYFTYGSIVNIIAEDDAMGVTFLKEYVFTSSLLVPAHLMIFKKTSKGRLVFTMGPDFYLPIHFYGKVIPTDDNSINLPSFDFHARYSGSNFFKEGTLGFTAGIGYEKKFKHGTTVEFMPDFRVLNLVPFDFQKMGTHIYHNYIFSMALGLSTYITFY